MSFVVDVVSPVRSPVRCTMLLMLGLLFARYVRSWVVKCSMYVRMKRGVISVPMVLTDDCSLCLLPDFFFFSLEDFMWFWITWWHNVVV